jgi:hypothetical protein
MKDDRLRSALEFAELMRREREKHPEKTNYQITMGAMARRELKRSFRLIISPTASMT